MTDRDRAAALDAADPLAELRAEFVSADPAQIYLAGNSLGRLPRRTADRLDRLVRAEWGGALVGGWEDWLDLPVRVGDALGQAFLGAGPGQVLVADSTTVDLHKLAAAALAVRPAGRDVVITSDDNFPTDLYVLAEAARAHGAHLEVLPADPVDGLAPDVLAAALDYRTALVSLSLVSYRSSAFLDLTAITAAVRAAGARTLWDLSHAVGSVPVDLDAAGADLAVGCTYKYLNGGPGAPAFLYVRAGLAQELRSPLPGWFGTVGPFAMAPAYEPAAGVLRFAAGTPPVAGVVAVGEGVALLAAAGIDALRAKSVALTGLLAELAAERLAPYGVRMASPSDPDHRGGHVALSVAGADPVHADAARLSRALAARGVVGDARPPDLIRLAPVPANTRFVDVWDAVDRAAGLLAAGDLGTVDVGRVP